MFDVYNRFSDEKKDYFYSLAHDEELVEWIVKRHLKEIGEKFSKKKWEQERDKLVSEYRDRAERIWWVFFSKKPPMTFYKKTLYA